MTGSKATVVQTFTLHGYIWQVVKIGAYYSVRNEHGVTTGPYETEEEAASSVLPPNPEEPVVEDPSRKTKH